AQGRQPGAASGCRRGGGAAAAGPARPALAHSRTRFRTDRPARSGRGCGPAARRRAAGPVGGGRRLRGMVKLGKSGAVRGEERREAGGRESLKAALGRVPVVAAVDLGASKVACFIMKADGVRRVDRTLTTAGVGYVQSRGVRGGTIVNLDEASEAIAQAVERAENVAGVSVQGVTVSTAGGQLAS